VVVGIVLMIVWSFWIGLIIALVGLIAFGGFARGRWYQATEQRVWSTRGSRSSTSNVRIAGIAERYQRPGWSTTHVFDRALAVLTRIGLSVAGSRVLEVRGRKTGEPRALRSVC
jgi:hypothetical protein